MSTASGERTPDRAVDYGVLRDTLGYQLRLADVATMQTFAAAFAGTGVSPARFTAMELIARNPGIRPATLGRAMAVRSSNLSVLLRELEADGWLASRPDADRRGKRLALSPAGREAVVALRGRLKQQVAMLGAALTSQERRQLSALLGKLVAGARAPGGAD